MDHPFVNTYTRNSIFVTFTYLYETLPVCFEANLSVTVGRSVMSPKSLGLKRGLDIHSKCTRTLNTCTLGWIKSIRREQVWGCSITKICPFKSGYLWTSATKGCKSFTKISITCLWGNASRFQGRGPRRIYHELHAFMLTKLSLGNTSLYSFKKHGSVWWR